MAAPSRPTIFYSWQSDTKAATNRTLIGDALSKALDEIAADLSIDESGRPAIDQDTKGVPGSPEIAATILQKIDAASVLIADVTIITPEGDGRRTPNPNVLFEVGYGFKALGPERIILVQNLAYGPEKELPFDLKNRRVVTYHSKADDENRSQPRKELASKLKASISAVFDAHPKFGAADAGTKVNEILLEAEKALEKALTAGPGSADRGAAKQALHKMSAELTTFSAGTPGEFEAPAIRALLKRVGHHVSKLDDVGKEGFHPEIDFRSHCDRIVELAKRIPKALRATDHSPALTAELFLTYRELNITGQQHNYKLLTRLENFGESAINDWHIDVKVPQLLCVNGAEVAAEVKDRSDKVYKFFRYPGQLIYPGDHVLIGTDYHVTEEMHNSELIGINRLFDLCVTATAYVDQQRVDQIEREVRALQHF